jgi:hypothetical protein
MAFEPSHLLVGQFTNEISRPSALGIRTLRMGSIYPWVLKEAQRLSVPCPTSTRPEQWSGSASMVRSSDGFWSKLARRSNGVLKSLMPSWRRAAAEGRGTSDPRKHRQTKALRNATLSRAAAPFAGGSSWGPRLWLGSQSLMLAIRRCAVQEQRWPAGASRRGNGRAAGVD